MKNKIVNLITSGESTFGQARLFFYYSFGQLVRENNKALDKTYVYSYNGIGNIASAKTYAYTTEAVSGTPVTTSYAYDGTQVDRLTSFGGKAITYDANGCVKTYDGWTYTWTKGKLTKCVRGSILSGMDTYTYTYDAYGRRTSKTYRFTKGSQALAVYITSASTTYTYDASGRLIREQYTEIYNDSSSNSREIIYLYDENGIIGVMYSYNGATSAAYFYRRNLQGDVTAIYDREGNRIGEYAYDAWGNCTILSGASNDLVSNNPIRYRGYYFDAESGFYFLNARYYNPQWRRFISPDSTEYLDPETPNGLNLYAYCGNDPVNYVDPNGHSPTKWGECFFIIGAATIAIALMVTSCVAASAAIAPFAFLYLGITANTTLTITTAVVAATSAGISAFVIADVQSVVTDGKDNYLSFLGNSYDDIKGALYFTSYFLGYMGQYAQPGWGKQTSGTKNALERGDPYGAYTKICPEGNDTTIYDANGYAITRYDFSHSHGGMNPHMHYFSRWIHNNVLRSNFPKGKVFPFPFSLP